MCSAEAIATVEDRDTQRAPKRRARNGTYRRKLLGRRALISRMHPPSLLLAAAYQPFPATGAVAQTRSRRAHRACWLDPRYIEDSERLVPVRLINELFELTAQTLGMEDFGLRVAETRGLPDLGPVTLVLREEETFRAALQTLIAYMHPPSLGRCVSASARGRTSHFNGGHSHGRFRPSKTRYSTAAWPALRF